MICDLTAILGEIFSSWERVVRNKFCRFSARLVREDKVLLGGLGLGAEELLL